MNIPQIPPHPVRQTRHADTHREAERRKIITRCAVLYAQPILAAAQQCSAFTDSETVKETDSNIIFHSAVDEARVRHTRRDLSR